MTEPEIEIVQYYVLMISSPTEWLVRILHDGRVEFGPGYIPEEAARVFWEAIASSPQRPHCPACQCSTVSWVPALSPDTSGVCPCGASVFPDAAHAPDCPAARRDP